MQFLASAIVMLGLATAQTDAAPPSNAINLVPEFIRVCMKSGMDPKVISSYLAGAGAIPIPDPHPESSDPQKITGFLLTYPDHTVSVMLTASGSCAVAAEGAHGAASLPMFDNFVQGAAKVFDVVQEKPVPATDDEQILSSYMLADKDKQFRVRYTLSIGKREGKPDLTIISRKLGAY